MKNWRKFSKFLFEKPIIRFFSIEKSFSWLKSPKYARFFKSVKFAFAVYMYYNLP